MRKRFSPRASTLVLLVLAAGLTGCDNARPTGPSSPSAPPTEQAPRPTGNGADTYGLANGNLSGVVYEVTPMGRVPIEGVRIQSDHFHVFPTADAVTDSRGFFSFGRVWVCPCSWAPWVDAGVTAIYVEKDGYEVAAGQPASIFGRRPDTDVPPDFRLRDVTIDGDTRIDIELVRR
jgi:hypothetical protein